MSPALRLTIGCLATALLGLATVHAGLIGPSHGEVSAKLEAAVTAALLAEGHDWAEVRMDGQRAILLGTAPSAEALREARRVAVRAVSVGGPVAGGVTGVDIRHADVMPASDERAALRLRGARR